MTTCVHAKIRYATEAEALAALEQVRQVRKGWARHRRRRRGVEKRAYLCPWCDGYHLTHLQEKAA